MISQEVQIPIHGKDILPGILTIPTGAKGLVLFAHGSGSSRLSPRNNFVASVLHKKNIATLLFDLLTKEEDQVYEQRFDIPLLTKRLERATGFIKDHPEYKKFTIGFFGSSTGSAAALYAAAQYGENVAAVVSRGGRPDLAKEVLDQVLAPTLLIVGGADTAVLALNEQAYALLTSKKKLYIVPGATHLFEESGALEDVANAAADWFARYL